MYRLEVANLTQVEDRHVGKKHTHSKQPHQRPIGRWHWRKKTKRVIIWFPTPAIWFLFPTTWLLLIPLLIAKVKDFSLKQHREKHTNITMCSLEHAIVDKSDIFQCKRPYL